MLNSKLGEFRTKRQTNAKIPNFVAILLLTNVGKKDSRISLWSRMDFFLEFTTVIFFVLQIAYPWDNRLRHAKTNIEHYCIAINFFYLCPSNV